MFEQLATKKQGLLKLLDEEQAFLKQREQLRAEFPGQFVAIHEGHAVDSDHDRFELTRRIRRAYPNDDLLIRSVDYVEEPGEMLSPMCAADL